MTKSRKLAPVLVLDIGNVCLRVDLPALLAAMGFASWEELLAFDPDGRLQALVNDLQCGRVSAPRFLRDFGAGLPVPQSPTQARATWDRLIGAEIAGMAATVAQARAAGLRVVFLSDICPLHYDLVRRRLSFIDQAAGAVLSYEVGAQKPAAAMYVAVERQFCGGRPPLLYADDRADNVAAARARGWPAHRFRTDAAFRTRLRAQLRQDAGACVAGVAGACKGPDRRL
jgi:FMN phosphatase YigB (HAD superfamily)